MEDQILKTNEEQSTINIEEKISEWIERGEKIIYPQNFKDWTNCVKNRANDSYNGADLECALEVMEALEFGTDLDILEDKLNRASFSESAHYLILRIILAFSKKGPELMEYITHGDTPEDLKQAIDSQKRENEKFESLSVQENNNITTNEVETNNEVDPTTANVSLVVVKKKSIFARIISFIKGLFKPKHKLLGTNEKLTD